MLDNYNTEYTERLHINLAKDAYCAMNHKDEFSQMTLWLEWKEKVFRHHQYITWQHEGSPDSETVDWTPPGLELDRYLSLSIHPTVRAITLDNLKINYRATHFRMALQCYIMLINHPNMH